MGVQRSQEVVYSVHIPSIVKTMESNCYRICYIAVLPASAPYFPHLGPQADFPGQVPSAEQQNARSRGLWCNGRPMLLNSAL